MERLREVSGLADGWLGQGSLAPDKGVISWLEGHIAIVTSPSFSVSIIPAPDGSVLLQWSVDQVEYTAELRPDGFLLELVDDPANEDVAEAAIPLSAAALRLFLETGVPA
jgi:hypothetical protein